MGGGWVVVGLEQKTSLKRLQTGGLTLLTCVYTHEKRKTPGMKKRSFNPLFF